MGEEKKVIEPFRFFTRLHLSELTGLKARNIPELAALIRTVPGSCIYHHTHRFLQHHLYLSPEPPNDFAHWVSKVLGDDELGEMLASIDTIRFSTIRGLREKISATIEQYIKKESWVRKRSVHEGDEFHFIRSLSFVLPTNYEAHDIEEFARILEKITIDSIYFHIFEARLRLEKGRNDFSQWIEASSGDKKMADAIARLDPYTYTMEDLRKKLITVVNKGIKV